MKMSKVRSKLCATVGHTTVPSCETHPTSEQSGGLDDSQVAVDKHAEALQGLGIYQSRVNV